MYVAFFQLTCSTRNEKTLCTAPLQPETKFLIACVAVSGRRQCQSVPKQFHRNLSLHIEIICSRLDFSKASSPYRASASCSLSIGWRQNGRKNLFRHLFAMLRFEIDVGRRHDTKIIALAIIACLSKYVFIWKYCKSPSTRERNENNHGMFTFWNEFLECVRGQQASILFNLFEPKTELINRQTQSVMQFFFIFIRSTKTVVPRLQSHL